MAWEALGAQRSGRYLKLNKSFQVGKHQVGLDHPVYFVADIAANHDGNLERAQELIHLCASHGANAAKFQNFRAETIVSDYGFQSMGGQVHHQAAWKKSVFEVYQAATLPLEWCEPLQRTCQEAGIDYFTSPYDLSIIDEIEAYVCAWKLGSGDITWHQEIERLARGKKPFLLATGASTMEEVETAVALAQKHTSELVLMQCNTNYTASLDNFRHIALNVLKTYAQKWPDLVLGLSDHTPGHATVLGSVALGARVIEKHFTDDTTREGPDHPFSMDARAWKEMVDRTRELELALGPCEKYVMENERETVVIQRRSVRTRQALKKGRQLDKQDLIVLRPCPADAIPPFRLDEVIGKRLLRDIEAGDYLRWEDLAPE